MSQNNSSSEVLTSVVNHSHAQIDLESLRSKLDPLVQSGKLSDAIEKLQQWIIRNPLNEKAFLLLGELYEQAENSNAAVVAFQRAMELKELAANYRPSPSLHRYQNIQERLNNDSAQQVSMIFDLKTHKLERSINSMSENPVVKEASEQSINAGLEHPGIRNKPKRSINAMPDDQTARKVSQ